MSGAGFTKLPNDVLLDSTLTPGARVAYAVIRHMTWKAGRRAEADAVALPPLEEVAAAVGVSKSTVKSYLADLRRRGLITTRRVRHQGMLYTVYDQPGARPNSGPELGQIPAQLHGLSITGSKTTPKDLTPPTPPDLTRPPKAVLVDGRSLPLDALLEVCGITPEDTNQRVTVAAVYLNGRSRPREPGIRDVFWTECLRQAEARYGPGAQAALAAFHENPARFAELLAARIRHKADRYRSAMPGAMLTPKALRDWWLDIESRVPSVALTSADLERLGSG